MCGIVGYIGTRLAVPVLLEGLKKLEYRGYDSAGIAVIEDGELVLNRSVGKLHMLEGKINGDAHQGHVGIGHTRWATHGRPSDRNSHPHTDCTGKIAVVHNGIIENFLELKEWLEENGHVFQSETDTEVLPHLVEHFHQGDLLRAVEQMVSKVRGSYATVVLSEDHPGTLVAARKDNPLIVGLGEGEYFFASDIPAIINYTRKIMVLEDGEIAVLTAEGVKVYKNGSPVEKEIQLITWDTKAAEKGGYPHFMIKEINEQPRALRDILTGRIAPDFSGVDLQEVSLTAEQIKNIRKIAVVACGTAYHAGIVGKYVMEKMLRIPVEVDIASEFRYRNPLIDAHTLTVIISQSGETADTLAALKEAKARGSRVVAITNVVGSSIAREAHDVVYTWAGPEIAVASTKAYITQLLGIYLLTLFLGKELGRIPAGEMTDILHHLYQLPKQAQDILDHLNEQLNKMAEIFNQWEDTFFVGRGLDYAVALEGSLKLKEISYVHAEAYAAGELKHGTLALIVKDVPVLALCTQPDVFEKTVSNIKEIKAREAHVIGVAFEGNKEIGKSVDEVIYIPETLPLLAPVLTVIPLQMLAYYASVHRGCDVDQPRNLAKSVTVE
ncbi:glutamine--fructose-6-phosphate transaminase (isomerizing) [Candidatus Formimonas warabiya]|uniref:glutamine--fructose-6-phosphate transaminase (isomerizing) n=1 Tax=Formimonas warabiya TaxID=1761012 RepID=UPI0011D0C280|nr:glutamine--fructose-6-phosphate transaminase (isomerizing) [Candidatus Formimonas warabiya]